MKSDLIRNRDIVIVGQQSWDVDIGSNCKNIALEFSKNNRVLYVNSPLDRITAWNHSSDAKVQKRLKIIRNKEKSLVHIQSNLWNLYPDKIIESINWFSHNRIYNFFNKRNNRIFANSIKKALKTLGFENIILFNDNDITRSFYLKEFLSPDKTVYYSRDYMLGVDYWKKHGQYLEPALIAKSDVCVANSVYLKDYCQKYNANSFYVGQGCDFDNIDNLTIPEDIKSVGGPIIGYVGALQSIRLDLNIIAHIATQHSDWNFVLVGPEDEEFKASNLHNLPNVYFLGSKPAADLPKYINAFDVCINPQIVNPITIGNYPRKIDEYLILGKPVVATKTMAMSVFKDCVYLGESKEEYIDLIEKALAENNAELAKQRTEFAASHTWENSVKEIYRALNTTSQI